MHYDIPLLSQSNCADAKSSVQCCFRLNSTLLGTRVSQPVIPNDRKAAESGSDSRNRSIIDLTLGTASASQPQRVHPSQTVPVNDIIPALTERAYLELQSRRDANDNHAPSPRLGVNGHRRRSRDTIDLTTEECRDTARSQPDDSK